MQGVLTPIAMGSLSPNEQAVALLAGFANGRVTMEGESIKHLPDVPVKTISQTLSEVWGMPKWKSRPAIKSKIAKKEPKETIAHQLAEEKPHTMHGPYSCFFGCACCWVLHYVAAFNCIGE